MEKDYADWNDEFTDWPHGACFLAVFYRMTPGEWTTRGFTGFRRGCDDLDYVEILFVEFEGHIVVLQHYPRASVLGTNLFINMNINDKFEYATRFTNAHHLQRRVIWQSPALHKIT